MLYIYVQLSIVKVSSKAWWLIYTAGAEEAANFQGAVADQLSEKSSGVQITSSQSANSIHTTSVPSVRQTKLTDYDALPNHVLRQMYTGNPKP
jgi:hypothetical protein